MQELTEWEKDMTVIVVWAAYAVTLLCVNTGRKSEVPFLLEFADKVKKHGSKYLDEADLFDATKIGIKV